MKERTFWNYGLAKLLYGSAAPTSFSSCIELVSVRWATPAASRMASTNINLVIILDPSIIKTYNYPVFCKKFFEEIISWSILQKVGFPLMSIDAAF
jgi:hypothetical protein